MDFVAFISRSCSKCHYSFRRGNFSVSEEEDLFILALDFIDCTCHWLEDLSTSEVSFEILYLVESKFDILIVVLKTVHVLAHVLKSGTKADDVKTGA